MTTGNLVYLDIAFGNEKVGRIVCKLYTDKAPKTAKNFMSLCKGDTSIESTKFTPLTLKNNYFHRIVRNFVIQCGDVEFCSNEFSKNDMVGLGGCSIYATKEEISNIDEGASILHCFGNFEDENMGEFTDKFLLAMANTGSADSNSSQFFITTSPSPHLNNKHSIFGEVIHGKFVVHTIENAKVDKDGFPSQCIKITDCGEWNEKMGVPLYNACNDTIGGDIYEEIPDDDSHFESEDFTKVYDAAIIIKDSGNLLFKKKDYQNAFFKYRKALRYVNDFIPDLDIDKENNIKYTNLKMKLYLNISLMLFNLKKYDEAIQYCTFLFEMDHVPALDLAKAHYRKGNCLVAKKRIEDALAEYKLCKEKNPDDKIIDKKIEGLENILEQQKERNQRNIAKFLSE